MNVLLVDIDSRIPNLALEKCRAFYAGHKIDYIKGAFNSALSTSNLACYDKIFVSVVFPENRAAAQTWTQFPQAVIGGTGWNIKSRLPEEIDKMRPKINWGFTTRGCIRNCSFCFVPQKEGIVSVEGDIYDIWDGKSKSIVLMDNNILALPAHFEKIAMQLRKEKLKVDFNQGLDHRLITAENAKLVMGLKHTSEIRLALDSAASIPTAERALLLLRSAGLKDWRSRWYVYCGPEDTFQSVYSRMEFLRQHKQLVYVMRDKKVYHAPANMVLSCWGNTPAAFKAGGLLAVCQKSERLKEYIEFVRKEIDDVEKK